MLDAILDLIAAIRSGDIRGIIDAFAALLTLLARGKSAPTITVSRAGDPHPVDTTDAHTITLS